MQSFVQQLQHIVMVSFCINFVIKETMITMTLCLKFSDFSHVNKF